MRRVGNIANNWREVSEEESKPPKKIMAFQLHKNLGVTLQLE